MLEDKTPAVPARRGRPPMLGLNTEAEVRQHRAALKRAERARKAAQGLEVVTLQLPGEVVEALRAYVARRSADDEPLSLGQAAERILRDRLLRKR